jgi:uncharacterized repeat protein (TIGR02543 family)
MSNRTFLMRRGRRLFRYFLSLALTASTLSAVSVVSPQIAYASAPAGPIYDLQAANYNASNGQWANAGSISETVTVNASTSTFPVKNTTPASVQFTGVTNGYQFITSASYSYQSTQAFTLSAWFKTEITGRKIIGFEDTRGATSSGGFDRALYVGSDGLLYFGARAEDVVKSTTRVDNNKWQYAVATFASGTMTLYLNGVEVATKSSARANTFNDGGYWRIGGYAAAGLWGNAPAGGLQAGYFNGSIGQVSIHDRELSSSEVSTAYSSTMPTYICNGATFTCQVGDIGPGGGRIFYVAPTSFTQQGATGSMCTTNCKYLEAAPNDWLEASPDPGTTWATGSNGSVAVSGAVGTAIGFGYQNSEAIKAQTGNIADTSAAVAARAYQPIISGVTYRDWFLPSKDELGELTLKASTVALRLGDPIYWSSSQSSDTQAWESDIYDGPLPNLVFRQTSKSANRFVRPIRAFAPPASNISTLSGLAVSSGTLSPTFATGTYSYTASVLSDTSTVTVTPTRTQENATIQVRVNSGSYSAVTSGSASGSLALNVGSNTINVLVTAQDGTTTATYTITVTRPSTTPEIAIGTTSFTPRVATNVGVVLTGFDETLSYQATVKFVNATTNADVSNGTLAATRGSTTLISGYTSYSSAKLGFKGTYAQIAAALASMTWNPATAAADIRMRIGISTVPGTNEFYDANSGRYYRFVPAATTWTQARTNAEATTLFGLRGYLAEITSAAENAFIANETSAFNIWMGATEDAVTAVGTDGKGGWTGTSYNGSAGQRWIWNGAVETPLPVGTGAIAQGPATAFSAWRNVGTIEPNNDAKPGADCGVTNWGARGVWNDRPCSVAYSSLIEFGGRPGETSTAIGATLTTAVSAGVAVQYTITYDRNGGNTTPTQASLTTGQTFNLANAITRNASGDTTYEFAGWRSGSVIYKAGDPITVGTANLAYTAVWVQLYEVTYVVNGGTFSGSDTVNDDQCTAGANRCTNNQSITLNAAPTRAGYTFDGWKDQSGAAIVDANSGVAEVQTVVTSTNYIFTATWTPITYTITYVSSGSTAPTQGALREGQSFTVAAAATKAGFEFTGWNDGTFTFLPDSDFTVQTSNITLTAQWSALYTVTYSQGLGSGTPATEPASYSEGSEIIIDTDLGISRSGFTFAGWNDGTTTFQPGASYTVGTSNVTLTAQWTAIPVAPAPVVVPTPVAPVGPPPSVLKTITNPKISRDDKGYYCQVGKYVFLREGRTEETPKLTTQVFSLLSNGTVIDSIKSALDKVLFTKSDTYLESTLTCQVDVGQENLMATSYSLNSADISTFASARKSAIEAADVKYYKDREDAYAKKDQEFVRLAAVRSAAVLASKSSREVSAASANYQKAYKAASELWKKELADASTNRVLAKELAQKIYLESLESAGISIYPTPVKAIATPTPTPTPTPKPTPTPTPTPVVTTNPQPTAQMVKVGTVYMATGSYSLNDATKITLKAIALKINASDAKSILVYGHTDSRGGVNNTVLSQNRAKAVANYLRPLLKGKKITVGWYASRKPVAGGNSAADLAKNRRVEIYSK